MNHLRSSLVGAALLACLAAGATAQTPAAAPPGSGTAAQAQTHRDAGFDSARRMERFEQRMAELKRTLQITAGQEAAWSSFAHAMRPPAQRQRPDREALARMATPDRIDHLRALRGERMAEMDRRGEATKAFYATLTAEQQKVFDEASLRRGHRHARRDQRPHRGHGG